MLTVFTLWNWPCRPSGTVESEDDALEDCSSAWLTGESAMPTVGHSAVCQWRDKPKVSVWEDWNLTGLTDSVIGVNRSAAWWLRWLTVLMSVQSTLAILFWLNTWKWVRSFSLQPPLTFILFYLFIFNQLVILFPLIIFSHAPVLHVAHWLKVKR